MEEVGWGELARVQVAPEARDGRAARARKAVRVARAGKGVRRVCEGVS